MQRNFDTPIEIHPNMVQLLNKPIRNLLGHFNNICAYVDNYNADTEAGMTDENDYKWAMASHAEGLLIHDIMVKYN